VVELTAETGACEGYWTCNKNPKVSTLILVGKKKLTIESQVGERRFVGHDPGFPLSTPSRSLYFEVEFKVEQFEGKDKNKRIGLFYRVRLNQTGVGGVREGSVVRRPVARVRLETSNGRK
jgi:hypothetical protein